MWKNIFTEVPANNQIVWVRVLGIYGQLCLAKYSAALQQFTTVNTSVKIPVYFVGRWKAQ